MNTRNPYTDLKGKLNVTGENIKYYRIKNGLSAQQLSDKLRELNEEKKNLLNQLNSIQEVEEVKETASKSYEDMNLQELKQVAKSKGYKIRTKSVNRFRKELADLDYFYENKGKCFREC